MTYIRNQPVATDDLSVSAPILSANTNKADDSFGIDHYQFSDLTANNGFHKRVTLPGNAAVPAPIAGYGDMYAVTVSSITQPYWKRDGNATVFNMLPIKAFGSFTGGTGATINALNITAAPLALGQYTITIGANVLDGTTNYCVLIGTGVIGPNSNTSGNRVATYEIINATTFNVSFAQYSGTFLDPDYFTVTVLQA